jgi:hypothetical protein
VRVTSLEEVFNQIGENERIEREGKMPPQIELEPINQDVNHTMSDGDSLCVLLANRFLIARKNKELLSTIMWGLIVGLMTALTIYKVQYKFPCMMTAPDTVYNSSAIVETLNIGVPNNYRSLDMNSFLKTNATSVPSLNINVCGAAETTSGNNNTEKMLSFSKACLDNKRDIEPLDGSKMDRKINPGTTSMATISMFFRTLPLLHLTGCRQALH